MIAETHGYGYGLWPLVVVNAVLFIVVAISCFHPRTGRDWKAMGGFSAFVVALMVEMYGFPLTFYFLSGWVGSRFDLLQFTHDGGHLWNELPTIPTLIIFPFMVSLYHHLAINEETDVAARFGQAWDDYACQTPRFLPHLRRRGGNEASSSGLAGPPPSRGRPDRSLGKGPT